jgi:hypothetical protein
MTIKIDTAVFGESMGKTYEIFQMSSKLRHIDRADYNNRRPSFTPLVSEAGYTEFHPVVMASVVEPFRDMFSPIVRQWHDKYFMSENDDEARTAHDMYRLAGLFHDQLSNEDIVNGNIPQYIKDFIAKRGLTKQFSSPKLSRALAKMASDTSPFLAWYTNKCPKRLAKGENKDFKVVVSTLPHHIAGMAYYSSFNFGGKRWNGWEGTSCQDPSRNSGGQAMLNLPASVKDESLAVAYLTKSDNNDLFNPIMEARALIRVVELTNGNVFYVVLRQFGYTESIAILLDGLANQYSNIITNTLIRDKYGNGEGKCIRIKMKLKDVRFSNSRECGRCEGTGRDDEDDQCHHCDGNGHVNSDEKYLPYNDDSDLWSIDESTGTRISYRIPKQLLVDRGLYGVEEDTHEVA